MIEADIVVDESALPGNQGRIALAVLGVTPHPVSRADLAAAMWDEDLPDRWEKSLSPILSKVRKAFDAAGADGSAVLSSGGSVELRRDRMLKVDVMEATRELDAAEGAIRRGEPREAWRGAAVATAVFRRPFLPGADGAWISEQRRKFHTNVVRAFEVIADAWILLRDPAQAVTAAETLIELDMFRETGYARLMRAQALAGNRAEALRTYTEARRVLVENLGVEPSARLQAVYDEIL